MPRISRGDGSLLHEHKAFSRMHWPLQNIAMPPAPVGASLLLDTDIAFYSTQHSSKQSADPLDNSYAADEMPDQPQPRLLPNEVDPYYH